MDFNTFKPCAIILYRLPLSHQKEAAEGSAADRIAAAAQEDFTDFVSNFVSPYSRKEVSDEDVAAALEDTTTVEDRLLSGEAGLGMFAQSTELLEGGGVGLLAFVDFPRARGN